MNVDITIRDGLGNVIIDPTTARLLAAVEQEGSITSAAKACGLSYRHAWVKLNSAAEQFVHHVVVSDVGGPDGGGTRLTTTGKAALEAYTDMHTAVEVATLRHIEILKGLTHEHVSTNQSRPDSGQEE